LRIGVRGVCGLQQQQLVARTGSVLHFLSERFGTDNSRREREKMNSRGRVLAAGKSDRDQDQNL
jgi:hypothetical protein